MKLKGSELTSAQVLKFIDYVEECVRAGTYNATTIANLVDRGHRTEWDFKRILDVLREIYPLNESERFVNKEERWEAVWMGTTL